MASLVTFWGLYQQQVVIAGIGFLLGILLAGLWLSLRYRQQLLKTLTAMHQAREEAAGVKGQLEQLQYNMQQQSTLLTQSRSQLGREFENLANRIFEDKQQQFHQQSTRTLSQNLDPLKLQLGEFKKQVTDVYQKESAERNQLMGKIGELQQQTHKIGEDAVNLAQALKGENKFQGHWGEVILERLLEESGLQKGREYDTQITLNSDEGQRRQPDIIIYLPDDKQLVIDAKVSLVHYERYCSSHDEDERALALKAHIQSIRQHVKTLSRKNYQALQGIQTLDFVFIFMPIEAAFMLALKSDSTLFQEAYDHQIVLVSPTTLMASLRTVSNIWRYHKQHKNAEKIAVQAGGLYDQFALVLESLDDLGVLLEKTQTSYLQTRQRLVDGKKGNLIRRIEQLRELGAKTKKSLPIERLLEEELATNATSCELETSVGSADSDPIVADKS